MDKMLYKYTTLDALALILKSKRIRLNPLTYMDDLQEAESKDAINYAKYVFISSWMDQPKESIAMWKLYSNTHSGVRIGLKEKPFEKYRATAKDFVNIWPGMKVEGESIDLILPVEECFNEKWFLLNMLYEKNIESVEYTDSPELLSPQIIHISNDEITLQSAELGKYKNSYWEFQNEKRYVLRFLPINSKMISATKNAAQMVYSALQNTKDFLPYYDLRIQDSAFQSMEITLSPGFHNGNRVIIDALREKYNPKMVIRDSSLAGTIRL